MRIKPGTRIFGLRPEILLAINIAEQCYNNNGEELVITSAIDGKHSDNSLHYAGYAVDFRLPAKTQIAASLADAIRDKLGMDFDVILEKDHIHCEFQPKKEY